MQIVDDAEELGKILRIRNLISASQSVKLIQPLGKYDSASQGIDARDPLLEVWKGKLKGMFFRFVPR